MSRTLALTATATCVLDGDGNGASSNDSEAIAKIYAGHAMSQAYFVDGSSRSERSRGAAPAPQMPVDLPGYAGSAMIPTARYFRAAA